MSRNITLDYVIRGAWTAIARMYNEQAAQYGSTMVYGLTLLSIDPKSGSNSTSLGPKMGIEPTSLSRTLNKLEDEGLILRESSQKDKRNVIIKLTKKGLEMRDLSKKYVLNFQNKIAESLTASEIENLFSTLNKIQEITNEINSDLKTTLHKKKLNPTV